jgi:very-short-patch-repair endonuclease
MTLDELLRAQAGVVTAAQARQCGMSARTISRRVGEGDWRVLHPRVYLVGGHRLTDEARVRAAWLWAGGCVSGSAAAYVHGMLDRAPPVIGIARPTARAAHPGVHVRRRLLDPRDQVMVRGVRVCGRARAVLETAVELPRGAAFLDRALQRHVTFAQLTEAHSRMLGAHGSAAVGRLLTVAADGAHAHSERLLLKILRGAGITGWVLHLRTVAAGIEWEIDVALPAARIAIEFDGWAWHSDVDRFRDDRRKGNALVAAGWIPLRFTWDDLDRTPERVLADIRAALARAA